MFRSGGQLGQFVPQPGLIAADLQRFTGFLQGAGLFDEGPQLLKLGLVKGKVMPVGQHQVFFAVGQCPEQVAKRNIGAANAHCNAQAKPVTVIGSGGADADLRGLCQLRVIRCDSAGIHPDMVKTGQCRQRLCAEMRCCHLLQLDRCIAARVQALCVRERFSDRCRERRQCGGNQGKHPCFKGSVTVVAGIRHHGASGNNAVHCVLPMPVQLQRGAALRLGWGMGCRHHQRRLLEFRQGRRAVAGDQFCCGTQTVTQQRVEAAHEAFPAGYRNFHGGTAVDQGTHRIADNVGNGSQRNVAPGQRLLQGGFVGLAGVPPEETMRRRAHHADGGRVQCNAVDLCPGLQVESAVGLSEHVKPDGGTLVHRDGGGFPGANELDAHLACLLQQLPQQHGIKLLHVDPASGGRIGRAPSRSQRMKNDHPVPVRRVQPEAVVVVSQLVPSQVAAHPFAGAVQRDQPDTQFNVCRIWLCVGMERRCTVLKIRVRRFAEKFKLKCHGHQRGAHLDGGIWVGAFELGDSIRHGWQDRRQLLFPLFRHLPVRCSGFDTHRIRRQQQRGNMLAVALNRAGADSVVQPDSVPALAEDGGRSIGGLLAPSDKARQGQPVGIPIHRLDMVAA